MLTGTSARRSVGNVGFARASRFSLGTSKMQLHGHSSRFVWCVCHPLKLVPGTFVWVFETNHIQD